MTLTEYGRRILTAERQRSMRCRKPAQQMIAADEKEESLRDADFSVPGLTEIGWDFVAARPSQRSCRLLDILNKFINRIVPDACPLGEVHEDVVQLVRDIREELFEIDHPVSGEKG